MNSFSRSLPAVVLALCLSACSTFDRDWQQAQATASKDSFSGAWEGRWKSTKHRAADGRLRAILSRVDARSYRARFQAQWLAFTSTYALTLEAQLRGETLIFHGHHDLGALFGGKYRYEGTAARGDFRAIYDSRYDQGAFTMSRRLTKPASIP